MRKYLFIVVILLLTGCGQGNPPRYSYTVRLPAINQVNPGEAVSVAWTAQPLFDPPRRESGPVTLTTLLIAAPSFSQKACGAFPNPTIIDIITADEQSGKAYQHTPTIPTSLPPGSYFLVGQATAGTDNACIARLVIVS